MQIYKLFLHNSLTRRKEEFMSPKKETVKMYACGPTVYNRIHLGNARSVVAFDIVYRTLQKLFKEVIYVRNITDVDDKINARAAEMGISISDLTERTTGEFHKDIAKLNVLSPSIEPRATEHIDEMLSLINDLVQKGHAYESEGHVLFDVKSFPSYARLSGMNSEEIIHGARVEIASYKKNPEDFVLWKPSLGTDPGWESPFGYGRPGWHIECSAMSKKYLGDIFDIHAGGRDLMFPHHENERAQSNAACGCDEFVRYWLHNGMLTVDGEKMSKSLGNFVLLCDALDRDHGEIIRWALLSSHYRKTLDWSDDVLTEARACVDQLYQALLSFPPASEENVDPRIMDALCDDFNTPEALRALLLIAGEVNKGLSDPCVLLASARFLGFLYEDPLRWFQIGSSLPVEEIERLIEERASARSSRDFARADAVRDKFLSNGIILEDLPSGKTIWKVER